MTMDSFNSRITNVLRYGMIGVLVGWFLKARLLINRVLRPAYHQPVDHAFFPAFMKDPLAGSVIYFLPLVILPVLFTDKKNFWRLGSAMMVLNSFLILGHQSFYNDATFVTCFWVSAWMLAIALGTEDDPSFEQWIKLISLSTVSLIFFGGVVGKLTDGYWEGQVLTNYYVRNRPYIIYEWMREQFNPYHERLVGLVLSRIFVIGEFCGSILWLLPFYLGAPFALLLMGLVIALSAPLVLSVFAPLIGMIFGSWWYLEVKSKRISWG